MSTFLWLLAAHFICDYPLQGDFLGKAKNCANPIPGVPWYQCLFAHAFIQAFFVSLITGNVWIGLAELFLHLVVDHAKCMGFLGTGERAFNLDQAIHIGSKNVWALL
jgi:hypothetical protein